MFMGAIWAAVITCLMLFVRGASQTRNRALSWERVRMARLQAQGVRRDTGWPQGLPRRKESRR